MEMPAQIKIQKKNVINVEATAFEFFFGKVHS